MTTNDINIETSQELDTQDVTCTEPERESQCENVICLSSDEEQPDSSDLSEQQPNLTSSVSKPSVSQSVGMDSEMSIDIEVMLRKLLQKRTQVIFWHC